MYDIATSNHVAQRLFRKLQQKWKNENFNYSPSSCLFRRLGLWS